MEIAAYRQPSVLRRKRASVGCEAFGVKKEAAFAVGNLPDAERAREVVRQRFQTELVAVRRLLEKAAAVPVPVPRSESKEPPAKRSKKASTSPAPAVARKMMAVEEEDEDVDIVGGVSPVVIAPAPLQLAEDDEDEDVDIYGDASPVVMPRNLGDDDATISGSPSSSSSDSDEDASVVDSPAPAERDSTPPIAELIARAKESLERQRKEARSKARERARQEVLETERRAMPNETIHPTVFQSLHIVEYNMARGDSLLQQLGLFLKVGDYGIEEEQQDHHRQSFEEDLEEGEIRL